MTDIGGITFDAEVIHAANAILDRLRTSAQAIGPVLRTALTDSEYKTASKAIQAAAEAFGTQATAAYNAGTGQLIEPLSRPPYNISLERLRQALALLKASGRIVQCGRGRGKAVVLISAQHITQDGIPTIEHSHTVAAMPVESSHPDELGQIAQQIKEVAAAVQNVMIVVEAQSDEIEQLKRSNQASINASWQ